MISDERTFIIAEAGLNHNGDLNIAKKLVDAAYEVGADAIKFQTFKAENLVANNQDESQYNLLKSLELSFENHIILFDYCKKKGIHFLSSSFDEISTDFLVKLGVEMFKIASSELTNIPLLEYIAQKNKPIILSTGMSTISEVEEAVNAIQKHNDQNLFLLHCVSTYPTNPEDVNLMAIETMTTAFHLPVGYSDHTLGIEIPIAAVTIGAPIIEKHFTLDRAMEGPDHSISLDPDQFKQMVTAIRNVEQAIGDGIKKPANSELPVREAARKSMVAKVDIPKGTTLTKEMITTKRPGTGIPPNQFNFLIGKKVIKHVQKDELLTWESFLS